jgi:hypothetical protein
MLILKLFSKKISGIAIFWPYLLVLYIFFQQKGYFEPATKMRATKGQKVKVDEMSCFVSEAPQIVHKTITAFF